MTQTIVPIRPGSAPLPETVETAPAYVPTITIEPVAKIKGDLGPKQLEWCRDWLGIFKTCERQVLDAEAHRLELLAKAGKGDAA